jgi:ribonuclease P protein subunit RPR2
MKFKDQRKKIAKERINVLFNQALEKKNDQVLSKRYIILARKLSTKYKISIPSQFKRLFCKKCNILMIPSKTCRVRLKGINIVYTCLNCKNISRFRVKY